MSLGNYEPRKPSEPPAHIVGIELAVADIRGDRPSRDERLRLSTLGVILSRVAIVARETSRGSPKDANDHYMNSVRLALDALIENNSQTLFKQLVVENLRSKSEEPLRTEVIEEALIRLSATLEDIISDRIKPEDPRLLQLKEIASEVGNTIINKLGRVGVL